LIQNLDIARAYLIEANNDYEENWAISKYPDWRVKPIWIPASNRLNLLDDKLQINTPQSTQRAQSLAIAFICVHLRLIFVSLSDRTQNIQIKIFPTSSSQSVFHHEGVQ
jgi:hypothetical protein